MAKRGPKFTYKAIAAALKESNGFMSDAARKLNCHHSTVCYRVAKDPRLQEILNDVKESRIDSTETKLFKLIDEDNLGAICFFLKTQAKHRGYIEREQIEHSGAITGMNPIQVNIILPDQLPKPDATPLTASAELLLTPAPTPTQTLPSPADTQREAYAADEPSSHPDD